MAAHTVYDRVAQTAVAMLLDDIVDVFFHDDSYGFRKGRSALDAVGVCRERCWRSAWVIDLDIKGFFDNVPWDRIMAAVAHHTDLKWVLLYVQRWLAAPARQADGSVVGRDWGTPQGAPMTASVLRASDILPNRATSAGLPLRSTRAS